MFTTVSPRRAILVTLAILVGILTGTGVTPFWPSLIVASLFLSIACIRAPMTEALLVLSIYFVVVFAFLFK